MSIDQGPRRIDRLSLHCKVADFQINDTRSALLIASTERQLQSYYLKNSSIQSKIIPMTSLDINCVPELFKFSGKKDMVHCDRQLLIFNNKKELLHKDKIRHLLVDDFQIALTTCLDTVQISSVEKGVFLGELRSYSDNISSLFWNNSLVISGDERGIIKLWDINKELAIHSSSFYNSTVDLISSYVDFIHTNLYYSSSKHEQKIAFHDLRTYRPIKITPIPSDVIKIIHNPSGKIFLLSPNNIHIIDLYQSYNLLGTFGQLRGQNLDHFMLKHSQALSQPRHLNDIITWNQYVVAGCDNGCIQVYNSDTLQCLYGYGICESSGIRKVMCIENCLLALEQKGVMSLAQFA